MTVTLSPDELAGAGKAAYQRADFPAAAQSFQAAAEGYRLADDPILAAEMENNRSVALLQAGDAESALEAVRGTIEVFTAAEDHHRQAMALGNQGAALAALGRNEEAEAAYVQAAELLGELGEDQLKASVMRSLSELQLKSGRALEAVASMQAGLDGLEKPRFQQKLIRKLLDMPFNFMNRS